MKVSGSSELDLADVFRGLETNKVELEIFDYSVSQSTLEQIFLQFAKEQEEERGAVAGMTISSSTINNAGSVSGPNNEVALSQAEI